MGKKELEKFSTFQKSKTALKFGLAKESEKRLLMKARQNFGWFTIIQFLATVQPSESTVKAHKGWVIL